jgi:prepilin-type N-terminal cleavage/methylation domain-containing protein
MKKIISKFLKFSVVSRPSFALFSAPSRRDGGFTLVETMVVVTVFVLVMSLALAVFLANVRSHRNALFQQRMINETSYALTEAEEELRNGNLVTSGDISNNLSSVIVVDDFKEHKEGDRTTIFLRTKIKTEEDRWVYFTAQTTAMKR